MSLVGTKMATRSKVWPSLLRDSLNLSLAAEPNWQQQQQQQQVDSPPAHEQVAVDEEAVEDKFSAKSACARWWRRLIDDLACCKVDCKQTVGHYLQCRTVINREGCFTCCCCYPLSSSSPSSSLVIARATLESCSCGPATSDIFCVAGAITVITGSLIAGFGVFPRNQARIRLYLECIGCAMVIMGTLMVFMSKKMKLQHPTQRNHHHHHHHHHHHGGTDRSAADMWLNNHAPHHDETVATTAAAARGRPKTGGLALQRPSTSMATNSDGDNRGGGGGGGRGSNRIKKQPSLDLDEMNLTVAAAGGTWRKPPTIKKQALGARDDDDSISSPAIVESLPADATADGNAFGRIGGEAGGLGLAARARAASDHIVAATTSASTKCALMMAAADENDWIENRWIPDNDDGYGEDHQAAIEAALSTVLTVSTLVGFRPDPDCAHNHCCLHHAVQHKINAIKWLNKLRRATTTRNHHQLTVPGGGQMEAETSLIECSSLNLKAGGVAQQSKPVEFNKLDQQQQREMQQVDEDEAIDFLPPLPT